MLGEKKKDPKTNFSEKYKDVPSEYICKRMMAVLEKIIIELQPYFIFGMANQADISTP